MPSDDRPQVVPPTATDIGALVAAAPPRHRAAIVMLAGAGLRISELLGLTVADVDFLRRTVRVDRQRLRSGGTGPLKTRRSARTILLGKVVTEELSAHLVAFPSDEWLFTDDLGRPVTYYTWQDVWAPTRRAAGLDVDTHALRHFYASALISGGASVKVVQERLGHGSASVTLNTYAHLWPTDDELTRSVIDAAFAPLADSLRTDTA
ncbi:site-specific integrase [Georgenia sp. 10Sc9-8]|uniref:Site-specific integrase n=1 Tax=Georgenia halotolerans TaxID=3028317 RepID=A0ABT5U0T7_9MICO|nr:site-specific integrase [Georgenia halotolerans]